MPGMSTTPMMQQYQDAKQLAGEALLLFRMGDFYELFFEDAKTAARVLGLTLTSRDKGENPIPMAGFPYHQLDGYLGKIIAAGFRAAVCEQVEDPKLAKGLVKREVTRVVTAGTVTDDSLLDPHASNYLASVVWSAKDADEVGVAWADLSTGRFHAAVFHVKALADQLARIHPAECLVSDDGPALPDEIATRMAITKCPPWSFALQSAELALTKHFGAKGLDGFGFGPQDSTAIRAAGAVLNYLQETQKVQLDHIDRLIPYRTGNALEIDEASRRSLEITRTIRDGRRDGSLLAVLDHTVTAMGSRMLAEWIASPLIDIEAINRRLDAVAEFINNEPLRSTIREQLRGMYDLERLLARVTTGRCTPRDLSFIGRTLAALPQIKSQLADRRSALLQQLDSEIDVCEDVRSHLASALVDDCPLTARDGGFLRDAYHAELDNLRELALGGKQWIANYQAEIIGRTGIQNLKVGFNKVFGYYIELTNSYREKAPDFFIRKQTLKNAERYITPELKSYEEKVLTADERAKALEYELFLDLRTIVQAASRRLRRTAEMLAQLDVLVSMAELARRHGYCRPVLVEQPMLRIVDGRHPVLDIIAPHGTFVPNDTTASLDEGLILLITGPNMAGKSTYIRQVALITLMAQTGSMVPAREATIGIADRIFARVGASDELSRGQSTFMVEMTETARILHTATNRSLVILDEIGRGTSTYDGVSLAWAIVEHIHDQIGCRTFFATHYHELTDLHSSLGGVRNLNVAVREWEDDVVFLHKIIEGAADKSYGIHVARLAGIPRSVNERAKQVLNLLEAEHLDEQGRPKIAGSGRKKKRRGDIQLTLFAPFDHPLMQQIRELDLNCVTPLDALHRIRQWQEQLSAEQKK
jgi:DNA mismatch repair protein MutS